MVKCVNKLYGNFLAWAVVVTSVFVIANIDGMWSWNIIDGMQSWSIDLAHHYALAFRISEHWWLPVGNDPTLSEMNIYPRAGHILAAIISYLVGSTFLGIHITVLLSIALLWLCLVYMLKSLPKPLNTVTLCVALVIFYINYFISDFYLHGHEIISNFFYSQLVGQALLFFSLILVMYVEQKKGDFWASIVLIPLIFFIAYFHLLPALQLFGLCAGLLATFAYTNYKNGSNRFRIWAIPSVIFAVGLFGIIIHPSFSAMRQISKNNGHLWLHHINYPFGLIFLCILVFVTSVIIFNQWFKYNNRKDYLVLKYLAIYGVVTAGLCLLQYGLLHFGNGSEYAVKKYVFALTTILYLHLSLIISMFLIGFKSKVSTYFRSASSYINSVLIFALSISLLFLTPPRAKSIDVSDIVLLEKKLIYLADTSIPSSEVGKSNIIIGLDKISNIINYMFSIAIARTPMKSMFVKELLYQNELSHFNRYSYIISSSLNKKYGSADCKSLSSGDISIVESQCVADRFTNAHKCSNGLDFTDAGFVSQTWINGFSIPNSNGRWTDGATASVQCVSEGLVFKTARLEITPFLFGRVTSQRFQVFVNGKRVYEGKISEARESTNPLLIDLTGVPSLENYTFTFKMPDAISPKEVGLSKDRRKLGFRLRKILFD